LIYFQEQTAAPVCQASREPSTASTSERLTFSEEV
jgi:hypothetical protein